MNNDTVLMFFKYKYSVLYLVPYKSNFPLPASTCSRVSHVFISSDKKKGPVIGLQRGRVGYHNKIGDPTDGINKNCTENSVEKWR